MNSTIAPSTQTDREALIEKHRDFFERAHIPLEKLEILSTELLEQLLNRYPNPIIFYQEFCDLKFERGICHIFEYNSEAMDLARFFYEEYPELYAPKNMSDTIEMIKKQAERADKEDLTSAFTDYITRNFLFSKYRKLKELIEEEFEQEIENGTFSVSFINPREFALYMLVIHEQEVEAIFNKYEIYYFTQIIYGETRERNLDAELRVLIRRIYKKFKNK